MNTSNQVINQVNCVIIGQREFYNWSAYGVLRLNRNRIHYFDSTEETFNDLMNSANDFNNIIGVEYFFVVLDQNYQAHTDKRISSENFYLPFESVESIYVFDETAYERMKGGAKLANVELKIDEDLSALGKKWQEKHNQYINDFKAKRFLGLFRDVLIDADGWRREYTDQDNLFEKHLHYVDFDDKNVVKSKHMTTHAWSVSNNYISSHLGKKDELKKIYDDNNKYIYSDYKRLSTLSISPEMDLSLSQHPIFLEERKQAQKIVGEQQNVLLFTLYVHYKMLIGEYFDSLGDKIFIALAKDVNYLKQQKLENEALDLLYWLGLLLPEVFVNQLYYAKNSKDFRAVKFDFSHRAKMLLEEFNAIINNMPCFETSSEANTQEFCVGKEIEEVIIGETLPDGDMAQYSDINTDNFSHYDGQIDSYVYTQTESDIHSNNDYKTDEIEEYGDENVGQEERTYLHKNKDAVDHYVSQFVKDNESSKFSIENLEKYIKNETGDDDFSLLIWCESKGIDLKVNKGNTLSKRTMVQIKKANEDNTLL